MTVAADATAAPTTWLVASGDQRLPANQAGWAAQAELEANLQQAFRAAGVELVRAHPYDPVVVAEAVWQFSHHVLGGLRSRRGPILTAANWSGEWPGLVGLLNLNASLT